ncbi:hypothetical protein BYT27DRAFT_7335334 [Phlegmacium glaucopus]|nr:hypothetical protein BYT27DRAFT_7335334 [Phlegmacium glaucopus]
MSNESPSKNNRLRKVTRFFKATLSSSSRSPTPLLIDVGSSPDNHTIATTDSSNLPLNMAPVAAADHAPVAAMEAYTMPPPIPVPVPATIPAVPRHPVSVSSPTPDLETPATITPNTHSPKSLFEDAHNVYMSHPTITVNHIQNVFTAGGTERTRPQILAGLRENLLPRPEFAEYDGDYEIKSDLLTPRPPPPPPIPTPTPTTDSITISGLGGGRRTFTRNLDGSIESIGSTLVPAGTARINTPMAAVWWVSLGFDEFRLYFVSRTNILQEMVNSGGDNWGPGVLNNQNFTVDPGSSLSAAIPPLRVTFPSSGRTRYATWGGDTSGWTLHGLI